MNRPGPSLITLIGIILAALLLAACSGTAPEEPAPTATAQPTKTRIPLPNESNEEQPSEEPDQQSGEGSTGAAGMRTFVIDPAQSRASYLVDEEFFEDALSKLGINAGKADVVGTTENVAGQIAIDLQDLSAPLGETTITADLSTLSTDQRQRDRWLQENGGGPQFSSAPLASFTATSADGLPDSYSEGEEVQFQLSGDLAVRGATLPVVFDVTAVVSGGTLSGTAETRLLMSDLGITPPDFARTLKVADEFGIRVELVAREQ